LHLTPNGGHSEAAVVFCFKFSAKMGGGGWAAIAFPQWQYLQGITPGEGVKVRLSPVASKNLLNNWL